MSDELYEWQRGVAGFGEAGQARLKAATVLVSRCGGVGGALALQLAMAGVGRLILAHGGNLRANDLNRQLLMSYEGIGKPRVELAAHRLREVNPFVEVVTVNANVSRENADNLVAEADVVASCAPLFHERLLLNQAAVRCKKPLVDCGMFELEGQLTTIVPGETPCLACLYPAEPPAWKREFPVFGAVASALGSLGAMEVIKVVAGLGETLRGKMLLCDLRDMTFRSVTLQRNPACAICGRASPRDGG